MDLVPRNSSPNGGSGFNQQGQVDWVALGQCTFSAPVAILSRLSSAGVEPLTVAVGQAMCSRVPLNHHGEKVLSEAMKSLTVCSSFGDAIWFGVGVRHILRDMVKTSQGASLITLCAALSEGHTRSVSALILHEMVKHLGGPNDLSPSFAQWETLVKTCASVFCHTTLGLRIDQMASLGEHRFNANFGIIRAGSAKDMAEILFAIGDVVAGKFMEITVTGGPACAWVAAFADYILGLRIVVTKSNGDLLYMNFDPSSTKAQLKVIFGDDQTARTITCVGRVFHLRNGDEFIERCLSSSANSLWLNNAPFFGGRVKLESMLGETFGKDMEDLLNCDMPPRRKKEKVSPTAATNIHVSLKESDRLAYVFARLFIAGAALILLKTTEACRYQDLTQFVHSASDHIPELRGPILSALLRTALSYSVTNVSEKTIGEEYQNTLKLLLFKCRCDKHHFARSGYVGESPSRQLYCFRGLAETVLALALMLGCSNIVVPMHPKRSGLLDLYREVNDPFRNPVEWHGCTTFFLISSGYESLAPHILFTWFFKLFSGNLPKTIETNRQALCDGTIYCFINTMQSLSDRYEQASIVHVGPGSIQVGHRLHYEVQDRPIWKNLKEPSYEAKSVELSTQDLQSLLMQDTSSPDLHYEAVVGDFPRLTFDYRILSMRGEILVSPYHFNVQLAEAVKYKIPSLPPIFEDRGHDTYSQLRTIFKVDGEGVFQDLTQPHGRYVIAIRPHHLNVLGRCAALATASTGVCILSSPEDYARFEKYISKEGCPANPVVTLIT